MMTLETWLGLSPEARRAAEAEDLKHGGGTHGLPRLAGESAKRLAVVLAHNNLITDVTVWCDRDEGRYYLAATVCHPGDLPTVDVPESFEGFSVRVFNLFATRQEGLARAEVGYAAAGLEPGLFTEEMERLGEILRKPSFFTVHPEYIFPNGIERRMASVIGFDKLKVTGWDRELRLRSLEITLIAFFTEMRRKSGPPNEGDRADLSRRLLRCLHDTIDYPNPFFRPPPDVSLGQEDVRSQIRAEFYQARANLLEHLASSPVLDGDRFEAVILWLDALQRGCAAGGVPMDASDFAHFKEIEQGLQQHTSINPRRWRLEYIEAICRWEIIQHKFGQLPAA